METFANTIIQTYGIFGLLFLLMIGVCYLIWGDRKNKWGAKIDTLQGSVKNLDNKIDLTDEKMANRINNLDGKIDSLDVRVDGLESKIDFNGSYQEHIKEVQEQATGLMLKGLGGKLSQVLKKHCSSSDCDHIFLGSFHNGTSDLRGTHYCRFDILIDEFRDPLHLRKNDVEFHPLYQDENVLAYGNMPHAVVHAGKYCFDLENQVLFDSCDILYRRCKSRDIKQLAFCILYDKDSSPMGFVGAVSYIKREINMKDLELCAREIENIYNS